MALVPRAMRPSVVIRRKAVRSGFLGPSTFWKVVGVWVFGKATIKKFFGRSPERIGVWRLGPNRSMQIITAVPVTRRRRRRLRKQGAEPLTLAEHRALAQMWADEHAPTAS